MVPERTPLAASRLASSLASPCATAPKPPSTTLQMDRFIALHMMYERMAPELPTSAPTMMRTSFPSRKPVAAAAHPE